MRTLAILLFLIASNISSADELSISVSSIHPQSKKILRDNGGKIPNELKQNYLLLYFHNSGETDKNTPLENGVLVSKTPIVKDNDFIGFETLSTSFGNLGGVIHLRLEARPKIAKFIKKNSKAQVALVIDGSWVFYKISHTDIHPHQGVVVFSLMNRYDEKKFQLLSEGKRGEKVSKACEKYMSSFYEGVPEPFPVKQKQ